MNVFKYFDQKLYKMHIRSWLSIVYDMGFRKQIVLFRIENLAGLINLNALAIVFIPLLVN